MQGRCKECRGGAGCLHHLHRHENGGVGRCKGCMHTSVLHKVSGLSETERPKLRTILIYSQERYIVGYKPQLRTVQLNSEEVSLFGCFGLSLYVWKSSSLDRSVMQVLCRCYASLFIRASSMHGYL